MTQPLAPVLADVLGFIPDFRTGHVVGPERGQVLFSKTGVTEKEYHPKLGIRELYG